MKFKLNGYSANGSVSFNFLTLCFAVSVISMACWLSWDAYQDGNRRDAAYAVTNEYNAMVREKRVPADVERDTVPVKLSFAIARAKKPVDTKGFEVKHIAGYVLTAPDINRFTGLNYYPEDDGQLHVGHNPDYGN